MQTTTKTYVPPTKIADETWVITDHQGEGVAPVVVHLNTMVIRGREPIVVDTGVPNNREQYLEDVFSIVEPEDVRWVYLSHDDVDHYGNLDVLLQACPNATLVTNWFQMERMEGLLQAPPTRWRWIEDGDPFVAGDRVLVAVRPPIFDSPTTRGLFDTSTGVYWASDAFAAPVLTPGIDVDELDPGFWEGGFYQFHQWISPWYQMLDDAKYQLAVNRLQALGIRTIAGCHTPTITGANVTKAFAYLRNVPHAPATPMPDQAVLDEIIAGIMAEAAA